MNSGKSTFVNCRDSQPLEDCYMKASGDVFVFHECERRKPIVAQWVEAPDNLKPRVHGSSMEQHAEA